MNTKNSKKILSDNACTFCGREFRSERTLVAHSCRLKQREQARMEPSVQLAFLAYQRFYMLGQGGVKKTWEQFRDSSYYAGFVRFASHIRAINAVNPTLMLDWLIKNEIKLDQWDSDTVYSQYLEEILYLESVELAVERSFVTMQTWADKFEVNFNQYLYHAGTNRLVHDLHTGQLSPWVLYSTKIGQEALTDFNEEQLNFVLRYIDPAKWIAKIEQDPKGLDYVKWACGQAGIL